MSAGNYQIADVRKRIRNANWFRKGLAYHFRRPAFGKPHRGRPPPAEVASKSGFDLPLFRRLAQERIGPETVCNRARL